MSILPASESSQLNSALGFNDVAVVSGDALTIGVGVLPSTLTPVSAEASGAPLSAAAAATLVATTAIPTEVPVVTTGSITADSVTIEALRTPSSQSQTAAAPSSEPPLQLPSPPPAPLVEPSVPPGYRRVWALVPDSNIIDVCVSWIASAWQHTRLA